LILDGEPVIRRRLESLLNRSSYITLDSKLAKIQWFLRLLRDCPVRSGDLGKSFGESEAAAGAEGGLLSGLSEPPGVLEAAGKFKSVPWLARMG
jgi:hypothetical protein